MLERWRIELSLLAHARPERYAGNSLRRVAFDLKIMVHGICFCFDAFNLNDDTCSLLLLGHIRRSYMDEKELVLLGCIQRSLAG